MKKEQLLERFTGYIKEAIQSIHYSERLYDRFLNRSELVVGYEIPGTRGEYEEVGTYILPDNIKQEIRSKAKIIEDYNFPKGKDYGILLSNVMIDKNKVNYYNETLKDESKNKSLLFIDRQTKSNGTVVYAIVRSNEIFTIYFAKNYVPQTTEKLRVDAIIKNINVITQGKIR